MYKKKKKKDSQTLRNSMKIMHVLHYLNRNVVKCILNTFLISEAVSRLPEEPVDPLNVRLSVSHPNLYSSHSRENKLHNKGKKKSTRNPLKKLKELFR